MSIATSCRSRPWRRRRSCSLRARNPASARWLSWWRRPRRARTRSRSPCWRTAPRTTVCSTSTRWLDSGSFRSPTTARRPRSLPSSAAHHPALFEGLAPLLGSVRAGKLVPLAVSSASRLPGYESVPTIAETYPGFTVSGWLGVFAPAGTPPGVIERINADVDAVLKEPQVVARLAELIFYPFAGTPAELAEFVKRERVLWTKIARDAGIQPQ